MVEHRLRSRPWHRRNKLAAAWLADKLAAVLREIKNVKQEPGKRRRWFEAADFELIVWYDAADAVTGFQICYDLGRGGYALTWQPGGFSHAEIDEGDRTPLKNLAPVLVAAKPAPWQKLAGWFDACSATLEPGLREFVRTRLAESTATR